MHRDVIFSACGQHRYWLERLWDRSLPVLTVCMTNPSTADQYDDDPTIRWLIGWCKKRGYGGLHVVNICSIVSPQTIILHSHPVNEYNLRTLRTFCEDKNVLCAWGDAVLNIPGHAKAMALIKEVAKATVCLGITKKGQPWHPLRKSHDCKVEPYRINLATQAK